MQLLRVLLRAAIAVLAPHAAEDAALHRAARDMPDVDPARADALVDAAIAAQTPRVPAALVVALAWGESRFEPAAGPACGALQVFPRDLDEPATACAAWRRDLPAGVRAGVREIEVMLDDRRVRGDLRRALLYRACGNRAFDGTCGAAKRAWVAAALARARAIGARSDAAGTSS